MLRERVVICEIAGREIPIRKLMADLPPPPQHDSFRFSGGSLAPEQVFQFCSNCGGLHDCKLVPGRGRVCRGCRRGEISLPS